MKHNLIWMAAALVLFMGCEQGLKPAKESPILFDVAATAPETRAANAITSDAKLREKPVGIFASYTGKLTYENTTVSPDYMYNQKVEYTGEHWEYTPVKLWPNDANDYVSFFAYAPYEASPEEGSPSGIIGMSRSVDLGDPWINFRLPEYENQVDLLYGQRYSTEGGTPKFTPWLDQHKHNLADEPLRFVFKHALACIGDGVSVRMSDALYAKMNAEGLTITFTNLTINYRNLATKARLVLRSADTPNWKEIISGELTCSRTYNSGALPADMKFNPATANPAAITLDTGHGLFYIPLQIAGTPRPVADILLTYTVSNGVGSFTDVATASVTFGPAEAGTIQNFALTLNDDMNLEATVVSPEEGVTMPGAITPTPGF